ncbi:DNA ligase D [Histidinibacterium aquaticum]|uniref:DNA ligase (ATP) n=1 Tax=Histidinibacterium aquaticum TaxID=2613962 RepID=A0A5J5GF02_9RHOB|nr:DNA ligase D [Histidinibacterium aquaticum]KAA9006809.1 DNA ligase D [Histidinibacterium aquaticum]
MSRLEPYAKKRDFDVTSEPQAEIVDAGGDHLSFVVQKHDASRLHYDFRLEWEGALWSWAVTKGPSLDPSEKRLAVRTEDHPLAYGGFEGTIPEKEYGGGTVMLWDTGWWEPLHDPAEGIAEGKLHFRLHGTRMKGEWALVHMKNRGDNWLLIKGKDEFAGKGDAFLKRNTTSVTTGRTMKAIASEKPVAKPREHGKPVPRFRKVQLATLKDAPPEGEQWWHEPKFDGYRCLMAVGKGGVRLYTRNGKDWSDRFGSLCEPAAALDVESALIDGEVVAGEGGGDFSTLQRALGEGGALTFYAFDCLALDGTDLADRPLSERREALETALKGQPPRGPIRLSPFISGSGADVLEAMCKAGGEGVVSKRVDAPYRGSRSKAWIKSKCVRRAEFVIVGWQPSDKKGRAFSSLLLGSHEDEGLIYRGRVGTGFDEDDFAELSEAMEPLARKTAPVDAPKSEVRGAKWITPKLVAEIAYAEFTGEGRVRHGVYHGLREDKEAHEVSAKAEAETDFDSETKVSGVRISSADRVVYPEAGLTKGDAARHVERVAERMLEHAADRPLSLLRFPSGIEKEGFFQKHAGKGFPKAIGTVPIEEKDGSTEDYMYASTPEALVSAVQMGTLEFHIWGARRDKLERPDRMVFDLDPDEGLDFGDVKKAAADLRELLSQIGLESGAMVTGGKGVHVIVPLRRISGWNTVKTFSQTMASALAEKEPDRYTSTMSKKKRKNRIFIDWLRNERGATAIAPYSLRARKGAPVATPVTWEELEGLDSANGFTASDMEARLKKPCPLLEVEPKGIGKEVVQALEDWIGS